LPSRGRVVERRRRVRLGDVSPGGRLRLDAITGYLQDVANDDARDGLPPDEVNGWVVRRTVIEVLRFPLYGEELALRTWCSGTASRWAERRTQVAPVASGAGDAGDGGRAVAIEAASIWVHVDLDTGRPKALSPHFFDCYGEAAGGRTVRARLEHDNPPAEARGAQWPIRFVDVDVLGHVNNAAYWNPVEERLAARRDVRAPLRAELEYRVPVELDAVGLGGAVELVGVDDEHGFAQWWRRDTTVHASARVVRVGVT
jgi:acyl-ACP thioesterase